MDRHHDLAELLLSARRDPAQRLITFPEAIRPRTAEQSYLVQREVAAQLGPIGGWKVGSPSPDSPLFTCAPLPARHSPTACWRYESRCPVSFVP